MRLTIAADEASTPVTCFSRKHPKTPGGPAFQKITAWFFRFRRCDWGGNEETPIAAGQLCSLENLFAGEIDQGRGFEAQMGALSGAQGR